MVTDGNFGVRKNCLCSLHPFQAFASFTKHLLATTFEENDLWTHPATDRGHKSLGNHNAVKKVSVFTLLPFEMCWFFLIVLHESFLLVESTHEIWLEGHAAESYQY